MTVMTATSPLRVGPLAVYSRQIVSRLSHIDFVLFALVVLFGGLYLYSPDQAFRTVRYVAGELAEIAPWLAGFGDDSSVCEGHRGRLARSEGLSRTPKRYGGHRVIDRRAAALLLLRRHPARRR